MSNEKRGHAVTTEHALRRAHENLNEAERHAQGTGDKTLIQKVTKVREAVVETCKDLHKKLDNHSG